MNIGIIGAIGVDDMGDVVMLQSAINLLKDISYTQNYNIEFTVFALNKKLAREQIEKIGVEANIVNNITVDDLSNKILEDIRFSNLLEENLEDIIDNKEYINKISGCDALFFIGGGYFNKYWGDKLIPTFILPIALGHKFKKPIYISGVNIGPFDNQQIEKFKGLFTYIDTMIIRDRDYSLNMLKKLGGLKGNLILGSDDILSRWYEGSSNPIYNKTYSEKSKYAVIQLHHWVEIYSDNYISTYKELARFLGNLLDIGEIDKIYFLPFSYFKGIDYECGRRLKTFLEDREDYIVLEPTKDYIFMRQLISDSEFVIGSRYHPVVFGMGEQVPTLGIYVNDLYKQKISGAFQVVGMDTSSNMIHINQLTSERLMKWYTISKEKKYMDKNKIKEIIANYDIDRKISIENFIKGLL